MKKAWVLLIGAATVLAGCFGGGDGDSAPAATAQVPDSASASVTGFIGYLSALVVSMADTLEPVDVSNVTPPADDKAEPSAID